MTRARTQVLTDDMQVLFGAGTCAGLTDAELLARFLASRDEAGELAFEALVVRHGPMVMRVCRNMLDDPHDVHEAFQAVFLVLARRGNAIRNRQSLGSWLYGVAVRASARARVARIRRKIRDRRAIVAAQTSAAAPGNQDTCRTIEWADQAEVVHHELARLPDKYRAPVVLCYLEGLTHDEAAARLNWPVGTVRSRLARAREKLRTRFTRRGITASPSIGPMASWLAGEPGAASRLMTTASAASAAPIARDLMTSILRSLPRQAGGRTIAAASVPSTSMLLAQGVLRAMLIRNMCIISCIFLPLGAVALGGGVLLTRQSRAQDQRSLNASTSQDPRPASKPIAPKPPEIDPMLEQSVEAARKRLDTQRAYYEEGRITLDRFIDACGELELAQLMTAQTDAERTAIKQRHVARLKEIEAREKAELEVGRGTLSDFSEAVQRRVQAETALNSAHDLPSILRRLNELERKVEQLQKERAVK